jgi:hypothetical protein
MYHLFLFPLAGVAIASKRVKREYYLDTLLPLNRFIVRGFVLSFLQEGVSTDALLFGTVRCSGTGIYASLRALLKPRIKITQASSATSSKRSHYRPGNRKKRKKQQQQQQQQQQHDKVRLFWYHHNPGVPHRLGRESLLFQWRSDTNWLATRGE